MEFNVKVSDVPEGTEIMSYMIQNKFLPPANKNMIGDMGFTAIPLSKLGLPSAEELLNGVLELEREYPPVGWKTGDYVSKVYTGMSTVYNKDFIGDCDEVYAQTMGSRGLSQHYGRVDGMGELSNNSKNTYYDSYGFRNVLPEFRSKLDIYNKFHAADSRGRIAYVHQHLAPFPNDLGWHVDEYPYHLLRINVPLRTSEEHILQIEGEDECGSQMSAKYHLEPGYGYIWNTRIPHRTTITKKTDNTVPRIHLIIGIAPWLIYNEEEDSFGPSKNWGIPVDKIVKELLFVK